MKIIAELHSHTNVSHHAVSTFEEMLAGAKRKDALAIAITNHGPKLSDGAMNWHFGVYSYLPKMIDGIAIIGGAEANILNDGSIDIDETCAVSKLDYVIASMHDSTCTLTDEEDILNAYLRVLENPYVSCIGHMGTPRYKYDYEKVISKMNEYGKILEINSGSFTSRVGSYENCIEIAKLCKKHNVKVAVTSDAHSSYHILDTNKSVELLENIGFDESQVINSSKENLQKYFLAHKGIDIFNR